jgi:hypothetical protein
VIGENQNRLTNVAIGNSARDFLIFWQKDKEFLSRQSCSGGECNSPDLGKLDILEVSLVIRKFDQGVCFDQPKREVLQKSAQALEKAHMWSEFDLARLLMNDLFVVLVARVAPPQFYA